MLLEIDNITVHYGKTAAVKGISVAVDAGEIITLIGNNGAGKSTTLRAISGWTHPSSGSIRFDGQSIERWSPEKVTRAGIAHVPEGRRVFAEMSVMENLEMGAYLRRDKAAMKGDLEMVFGHFPILKERRRQAAGTLSGGQQQMLAMGRALMSGPKVVLMDEPTLGLSPIMCIEIARIIREIHAAGKTIVLVEQNARMALALANRAYVMDTGNVLLEGPAAQLKDDPQVQRAYLGG